MVAKELISEDIFPIQVSDTGRSALIVMDDLDVKHLPVLDGQQYIGVISEEELLNNSLDLPINQYFKPSRIQTAFHIDHLFIVMSKMTEQKLSVIPVIDENKNYLGAIKQETILQNYANNFSFSEPGSIIVIEMHKRDYALSILSRIIESENVNVLSSIISGNPKEGMINVTLKLDKLEISKVLSSLERMGYHVTFNYQEQEYVDTLQDRYDALMHYLNI